MATDFPPPPMLSAAPNTAAAAAAASVPVPAPVPAPASASASASASTPTSADPVEPDSAKSEGANDSLNPGSSGFRRQRASRACETCHSRKVRCDAASLGVPCTNCVAFHLDCKIPSPKRKRPGSKLKDGESDPADNNLHGQSPSTTAVNTPTSATHPPRDPFKQERTTGYPHSPNGMPATEFPPKDPEAQRNLDGAYTQYMKPKFARAPIKEAGRVAYLGESSNLSLLVRDTHGAVDVVHYPLPDTTSDSTGAAKSALDDLETSILRQRGAFLLPPRQLCDELVDDFFTWIAPVVPVINRNRFMRQYKDPNNPPSLLLLQAILLAGSRVCKNPQLMDANGSTTPAALTFYSRAKALYEANYEDDRVTIVQALSLMAWHWDSSVEDVTKNVFYWSRVAIIVAQGSGMHRSVEKSQLCLQDKRLWKRIWWTLFTRDRSVAVALGRPVGINIEDSDIEMLTEADFIEDDPDAPSEYPLDPTHVQFFLSYVKLCEIMGLVLSQNYGVGPAKQNRVKAIDLTHCDMALADWLQNCPQEVFWNRRRHHFWSALLHSNYYTTLCLLHRAHMPPAGSPEARTAVNGFFDDAAYPSRNIAFQAAGMMTSIVEALVQHNQLRFTPAFIVYSLFSALLMHVYQMRSSNPEVVEVTKKRLATCMHAMKEVSKTWLVAKMVHNLFESILGNKMLKEKLQEAAGKRHGRSKANGAKVVKDPPRSVKETAQASSKRKLDEFEVGFTGPPAAKMSYERSHPASPAGTPRRMHKPNAPQPLMTAGAAQQQHSSSPMGIPTNEAFWPNSRVVTRQNSPFPYSYPGTPPDLFLHTRNSPNISQDLWQNYQPDQLFPAEALALGVSSPHHDMVDPALGGRGVKAATLSPYGLPSDVSPIGIPPGMQSAMSGHGPMQMGPMPGGAAPWDAMQAMGSQPLGPMSGDDALGTATAGVGAPIAPSTLNVGDWLEFFGIPNNSNNNDSNMFPALA